MDLTTLILLSSGLFLGWSLGANDAANIMGLAVTKQLISFSGAAAICSVFIVLGAVISGEGAANTLSKLSKIDNLNGAFMVAFAAALTVYHMVKLKLPTSTTQAIIGAIVGWNLFSGLPIDQTALFKIALTWIMCPLFSGLIAIALYKIIAQFLKLSKIHLISLDGYTRVAMVLTGAFGAYSLGANNIANVMGVFVNVTPFTDMQIQTYTFTGVQQLFLLGAVAIGVGVVSYSKNMMYTIGGELSTLTPVAAWVVVLSHSIVLFSFASQGLKYFLEQNNLPSLILVPVSSTQAVVGGIIGLGIITNKESIKWDKVGKIFTSWVVTPVVAAVICSLGLFIMANVLDLSF